MSGLVSGRGDGRVQTQTELGIGKLLSTLDDHKVDESRKSALAGSRPPQGGLT